MEGKPLVLVGVGKVGIGIVSRIPGSARVYVDTDSRTLMGLEGTTVFIGAETGGTGTGKAPRKAYGMAQQERDAIHAALSGAEAAIVVGAAGGGTAAGASAVVAECAKEVGIAVAVFMLEPLGFEGQSRLAAAKQYLRLIEQHADALFVLPGKTCKEPIETEPTLSQRFAAIENGLLDILHTFRDCLDHGLDIGDFRALLESCGRAQIGFGSAKLEQGIELAFEAACRRSFLDIESFRVAQGLSLLVVAPPELNADDLLRVTRRLEGLVPNASLDTHLVAVPGADALCRVLVISRAIPAEVEAPTPDSVEQPSDEELVLNGVNLEVPTYVRRARLRML